MSESAVPGSPPNTSNKVMVRNIITGVITTVVGATTIYFLGFHNSGGSGEAGFLVTKEATTNAWKSYVSAENVFFKNWGIYVANYSTTGFNHYKEATLVELMHFKSDLKKIMDTKNLDPSFISLLERRLKAKEEWENKYRKHLDNYEMLDKTITDPTEKANKLNEEIQRFLNETKELDQLFANEIDELCKTLTAKYAYTFTWADLLLYQHQPNQNNNKTNTGNTNTGNNNNSGTDAGGTAIDGKVLVGKWNSGANTLYQYEDGKMYYYFSNGDSTYGSWQLYNNQLYQYYNQYYGAGYRYVYNLSSITPNAFSIALIDSPYTRYDFVRATQ